MDFKHILNSEILSYERFYRANLINSITGFKSLNLIGTRNQEKVENLAVFSQVFHLGAHPPLIGMIVRPDTVPRHSLENMRNHKWFTLNHVSPHWVDKAHQAAANYPAETSEFEAVGLTPYYTKNCQAPYVQESNVKIGLTYVYEHRIPINNTLLVAGEIQEIILPERLVKEDGFVDLNEAQSCTVSGLDAYLTTHKLKRFGYPKPGKELSELPPHLF